MKKKIMLFVLIIFLIFSVIVLADDVQYDFRKTNWGMSREQVKATEDKEPDYKKDNLLIYNVKINGENCYCFYDFLENILYNAAYEFLEEHTNKNDYINDYEDLKNILIEKYDKLIIDKIEWKDDLYKDDKSEWGMAISVGDLKYYSFWETPTTIIGLMLSGDNYEITLTLSYRSKKLKEWVEQKELEKAKEDF